jgi:hypothetical protein
LTELQREILSAQSSALAANESQMALLKRIDDLEKKLTDLKTWDAEKEKYELKGVGRGALAYGLKEQAGASEPEHFLCPNCYHDSQKSILQRVTLDVGRVELLRCLRCKAEINLTGVEYKTPRPSGGFVQHRR